MSYQPIALEELQELGRRIDIELVFATHVEGDGGLYDKLSSFPFHDDQRTKGPDEPLWTSLCGPQQVGEWLVMPIVKPRNDKAAS